MPLHMIEVPKRDYDQLKQKADVFDQIVETEEYTEKDLLRIAAAQKTPLLSKKEFLRRHPDIEV